MHKGHASYRTLTSINSKNVKPRGILLQSKDGGGMSNGWSPQWEEPFRWDIAPLYIAALQPQHQCSTPFQNEGFLCPGC